MKRNVFLLTGALCAVLLSACAGQTAQQTTSAATEASLSAETTAAPESSAAAVQETSAAAKAEETAGAAETKEEKKEAAEAETKAEAKAKEETAMDTGAERTLKTEEITRVIFDYEWFNQYSLYADVENISGNGAEMEIRKTVGPMNYTGFQKEGKLKLDALDTAMLLEILGRYDIEGMSRLFTGTCTGPSRTLNVCAGDQWYDVPFNAEFPVTIPPVEDIMYFELYNFFNDRISREPGWEEVRSDNLEDPRDNPAYGERKVNQFGNVVRLEPGTGADYDTGKGARIDYGEKIWWLEEGFTGTWTITEEDRQSRQMSAKEASLTVDDDGSVKLILDGEEWTGKLGNTRYYLEPVSLHLIHGSETRPFEITNLYGNSYGVLSVDSHPGPVPTPQFPHTYVRLSDPERKEREAEARRAEEEAKIRYNADGSWICEECGESNTGDFCATCGKPKPGTRIGDGNPYSRGEQQPQPKAREVWPADGHIPTLDEVLAKEENHGPLTEVLWSYSRSGMMMGDYTRSSLRLYQEKGEWRLVKTEMPAFQPEIWQIYSASDEAYEKLQALAEEKNLSAWSFLKADPAKNMYVYDMTDSSSISLTFDDSSLGAASPEIRTIDLKAVEAQGGKDVWDEVYQILKDCVKAENLIETATSPNPYVPSSLSSPGSSMGNMGSMGFMNGMGSGAGAAAAGTAAEGTWICPDCGTANTGKFCSECGSRRPE